MALKDSIQKVKDGVGDFNGKNLEKKVSEYTEVYGEVLIGLVRRADADKRRSQAAVVQARWALVVAIVALTAALVALVIVWTRLGLSR